jgi:MFS transporter, DHA1 family, inner membrane transport protein
VRRPTAADRPLYTVAPAPAAPPAGGRPWPLRHLLLLSTAVFVSVTTELLPTGLLPGMSRDLHVSAGRLGLLVTAYALMVALLAAPIGLATARYGRRGMLTVALAGYAVCNAITAVSEAYPLTVVGRVIGGLSHGLFWGMLAGYAGRMVSPDRVGRAVTIAAAGGTAAVLLGVPVGTAIGVAVGWRAVFGGFAVVALVLTVVAARLLPAVPGTAPGAGVRMKDVVRLPGLLAVISATAVIMLGHFSFITYIAPFLTAAGVSETGLGPALLGYGAAGGLGLLLAGLVVDRRLRLAMLVSTALLAGTFVALAVAGFVGISTAVAVVGAAASGCALGGLPVFLQAATLRVAPGAAEAASALNASAFNIGIGGGALLGGLTVDHWGAAALPVVAGALATAGLTVVIAGRRVGATAAVGAPIA